MAIARVVSFDGVSQDRIREMESEMQGSEPPEGPPAKETTLFFTMSMLRSRW